MRAHQRYFPTITPEAFDGLVRLYAPKRPETTKLLRLYAVDGLEPEAIERETGVELANVLRSCRRAGELLADARLATGSVPRSMKMTPKDLRAWLERNHLEPEAGAKLVGVTSASMERYLNESAFLPRSLALACAAVEAGLELPAAPSL
ncbi:hypothetical protein FSY45_24905 [Comamonas sp. Z1]|uniref:hypothetical protein n=1 Tax=Comamonas sp. Z1 TaxID=2601246 RepID=UPI0011E80557|nr:hypothetical protein [Comamonas sp. Z1]TYK70303.1 hypothetical protein FSY45_24905 [Comamonas sp. Z1]